MSSIVRIAHLSDVHLGPITGFGPRFWNVKRATGYINWRRNRRDVFSRDALDKVVADIHAQAPDHIAVTGDLCNIGLPAEMDVATAWLAKLGPPDRVSVIPGNHDIYTTIGVDHGIERWAPYMTGDGAYAYNPSLIERRRVGRVTFPYVRRIGSIALIGLNSAVETPPFIAAGQLGADQRGRLAAILDETAAKGLVRVVMIHHPPLPGQTVRSHGLNDAAALRDVLAAHGAELVIHGHLHRAVHATLGRSQGAIPIIGVPSAALARAHKDETLARYHLIEVHADRFVISGRGLVAEHGAIVACSRMEIEMSTAQRKHAQA
jgi:3',5'-cyclic AMP phosphodiesterase CpdA